MRFKSVVIKASIVLGVLAALSIVSVRWHGSAPDGEGSSGMGIFLAKPAFAQEDGASFLEQEAGISAYTNVGRSIDLAKAKTAFRTVERETSEYIIGSVPLPGYPETEDVHAYVHRDGWIVTYYLKAEPAAKIANWVNYSESEGMQGTRLDTCILYISGTAEVPIKDVKYYDFRYPSANKITIIADTILSARSAARDVMESFKVRLPGELVYHERSFSHYNGGSGGYSYLLINDKEISKVEGKGFKFSYGLLSPTQLSVDISHVVKIQTFVPNDTGWSLPLFGFIVLIYEEL